MAGLLGASQASAQGPGLFIRDVCASPPFTNPVHGQSWCFESSTLSVKVWDTNSFVISAAGVGSINGLVGALTLAGTPNRINVVAAGSTITLSTPQDLAAGSNPSFSGLTLTGIAPPSPQCLQISPAGVVTATGSTCGGITTIGGQIGPAINTVNDTNVTLTWGGNTGTLGWTGTLAPSRGGFGADMSAASGVISFNAGTRVVNNVLSAARVLYAAAGNTVASSANLTFDGTTLTLAGIATGSTTCLQMNNLGVVAAAGVACGGGGGGGTVTNSGTLTANAFIIGNGGVDVTALALTGWVRGNGASPPTASATIPTSGGGFGTDVSAGTGVVSFNAGTPIFNNVLTAARVLYAAAGNTVTSSANLTFNGTTLTLGGIATGATVCLQIDSVGVVGTSGAACGGGGGSGVTSINTTATGGVTIQGTANQVTVGTVGSTLTLGLTNPINVDTTGTAATATVALGLPAGAPGRIPFYSGVNAITNDPFFFLDNSNKHLIISNNADALPVVLSPTAVRQRWASVTNEATAIELDAFGNQGTALFVRSNGTPAARSALTTDNPIGALQFAGAFSASGISGGQASFGCFAGSLWTISNRETYCTIGVTGSGSTSLVEAVRILSTRQLQLAVPLPPSSGGTGLASGTSGGIPYFSSTTTLASSALLTNHGMVVGGGAGAAPRGLTALTNGQVYVGSTGADPVPATLGSSTIAVTPGAGTLTLEATGLLGGAATRVPFWSSATTITSSANFTWNDAIRFLTLLNPTSGAGQNSGFIFGFSTGALRIAEVRYANPGNGAWPDDSLVITSRGGAVGGIQMAVEANAPWVVYTSLIERMRVTGAGLVGIGVGSPVVKLDVGLNPSGVASMPAGAVARITGGNATSAYYVADAIGGQGGLIARRINGTLGAPTQVLRDQALGAITAQGWHSGGALSADQASFGLFAAQDFTSGGRGAYTTLGFTPVDSTSLIEAARFGAPPAPAFNGTVSTGSTTVSSVTPISSMGSGNAPTTGIVAGARIIGIGIPEGTTVSTVSATSLTMSAAATSSGATTFSVGTQPTRLKLTATVTDVINTPTLMVYGTNGHTATGTWFPMYAPLAFFDMNATPGNATTTGVSPVALMTRNRYNWNSTAGGTVGIFAHSEWTGTLSDSLHNEVYGIASLNVLNPGNPGVVGNNAFIGVASQVVVKSAVEGSVEAFSAQIGNTTTISGSAAGIYGITINNGGVPATDLQTATAALRISAYSGNGVESWVDAIHVHDLINNITRFKVTNSGKVEIRPVVSAQDHLLVQSAAGDGNGVRIKLNNPTGGGGDQVMYLTSLSGNIALMNASHEVLIGAASNGEVGFTKAFGSGGNPAHGTTGTRSALCIDHDGRIYRGTVAGTVGGQNVFFCP